MGTKSGDDAENKLPNFCGTTLFDNFVSANSFRGILQAFSQISVAFKLYDGVDDNEHFYNRLRSRLQSWKAKKLWSFLDKRAAQKEYKKQKACENLRVLIIGAGPCGLRMAIECALLGAKVVVVERRDRFSRNNVLHLWSFVIQDLKNLGGKLFYPKFCAGSIDHISIRQLQCLLLKVALVLGVSVFDNIAFEQIVEPDVEHGWKASFSPPGHFLSDYEFDVLVGADGKRNTVLGFRRKEFRGKLAIGITGNFINRHTQAEERVPEISGVAFIFNQPFFTDLKNQTGIDLENIVYYKDETHYFVMCAKKQSLLEKGVILQDFDDISLLLKAENVSQEALMNYTRQAADFATDGALPHLDYAVNHYGLPDVAMFDFTSLFSAEHSSRLVDRKGHRLLISLVGDTLHEPFWPTGSGCARGFLGVLDTAWMLRSYSTGRYSPLDVLADRESIYRLLAQTTSENLSKNLTRYTIDPRTRYANLEQCPVLQNAQVRHLVTSDAGEVLVGRPLSAASTSSVDRTVRMDASYAKQHHLLRWCQQIVMPYGLRVENFTTSFRSGLVLGAIICSFRPALLDYAQQLDVNNAEGNYQTVLQVASVKLGISLPEGLNLIDVVEASADRRLMFDFVMKFYNLFCSQTIQVTRPQPNATTNALSLGSPLRTTLSASNAVTAGFNSSYTRLPIKRKLLEEDADAENGLSFRSDIHDTSETMFVKGGRLIDRNGLEAERLRLRRERLLEIGQTSSNTRFCMPPTLWKNKPAQIEKLPVERLQMVEKMMLQTQNPPPRVSSSKRKSMLKTRKLDQKEVEEMEAKLRDTGLGNLLYKKQEKCMSSQDEKIIRAKTADSRAKAERGFKNEDERFDDFDKNLKVLVDRLKTPHKTGIVGVADLREAHSQNIAKRQPVCVPPGGSTPAAAATVKRSPSKPTYHPPETKNPMCYFCNSRVYLAERMCVEGLFMHTRCFRCEYCNTQLRLGNYGYDRSTVYGTEGRFFCMNHLKRPLVEKLAKVGVRRGGGVENATPEPNDRSPLFAISPVPSLERLASSQMESGATPERAEFECSFQRVKDTQKSPRTAVTTSVSAEPRSSLTGEIEEELMTLHNSKYSEPEKEDAAEISPEGSTDNTASSGSSDDELSASEQEELEQELQKEGELGPEAVVRLAANWKRRRSKDNLDDSDDSDVSSNDEEETSSEDSEISEKTSSIEEPTVCAEEKMPVQPDPPTLMSDRKPPIVPKKPDRSPVAVLPRGTISPTPDVVVSLFPSEQKVVLRDTDKALPISVRPATVHTATPSVDMNSVDMKKKSPVPVGEFDKFKVPLDRPPPSRPTRLLDTRAASIDVVPDPNPLREQKSVEWERVRQEARAKAKLKSDEELGIPKSPMTPFTSHEKLGVRKSAPVSPVANDATVSKFTFDDQPAKRLDRIKSTSHHQLTPTKEVTEEPPVTVRLRASTDVASNTPEKEAKSEKRRSFLSFLGFNSPDKQQQRVEGAVAKKEHSTVDSSCASAAESSEPSGSPGASESTKEQSLLQKLGRIKYKKRKSTSKKELSPDVANVDVPDGMANQIISGAKSSGQQMLAPKATLDEISLGSEEGVSPLLAASGLVPPSVSQMSLKSNSSNVSEKDIRRVERHAQRIVRRQEVSRLHQMQEIQRSLQELEVRKQEIEGQGKQLEEQLRIDPTNQVMLQNWLSFVNERSGLIRLEADLNIRAKEIELEEQHSMLQNQLRDRISVAPELKSRHDLESEQRLLEAMLRVVQQRDALVVQLENERTREHAAEVDLQSTLASKGFTYANFSPVFVRYTSNQESLV